MWLLLYIALLPQPHPVSVLNVFSTAKACYAERDRIGREMADAYPYERTFIIDCRRK